MASTAAAPSARPRARRSSSKRPDTRITGVSIPQARSAVSAAIPSQRGMSTSDTIASKGASGQRSIAAR
ncbi:MAG: hypothetical protein U0326_41100 [Polyangiales bacterium]